MVVIRDKQLVFNLLLINNLVSCWSSKGLLGHIYHSCRIFIANSILFFLKLHSNSAL